MNLDNGDGCISVNILTLLNCTFKRMNFMIYLLYLSKTVIKKMYEGTFFLLPLDSVYSHFCLSDSNYNSLAPFFLKKEDQAGNK